MATSPSYTTLTTHAVTHYLTSLVPSLSIPRILSLPVWKIGGGGGGWGEGAECNHHDDVYHMYDVMVKSCPEGLHCQVLMCREISRQFVKIFSTLVPENEVSETTAFGKSYIYNKERMSRQRRLMRSWLISLINLLI